MNELNQHFNTYIDECQFLFRRRPETIRGYKEVFKSFVRLMPEINQAQLLTNESLLLFFKRLQTRQRLVGKGTVKTGIKDSTVRTYWTKLNSFFKWLHNKQHIQQNPLFAIQPPLPVYDDQRALNNEDIHKLIAIITLYSFNYFLLKRDILMINLLMFCGLRRNELLSIEHTDINLQSRLLSVKGLTSKSKKTRQIPLNPTVIIHLQEYLDELKKRKSKCRYLLVSNTADKQLSNHGLKHWVKRLNALSGVQFHLHRFRHSFACNLAKQNVNAVKIQRLMGHADIKMTMTYLRSITTEDFREDINKLPIAFGY